MALAKIAFGLMAGVGVLSAAAQQQPTFRSGVDLMTVDVGVLDKNGVPVRGLTPQDFSVSLDGKPRRVVSAEFIASAVPARVASLRAVPMASSNQRVIAPRTLIFLIDTEQIPAGGGRAAIRGIGDYIDRLGAADQVGIMTMVDNRLPPTTNRSGVRGIVSTLVGTSARMRDREMTFAEASGIAGRDRNALMAYWTRIVEQGTALPGDRTCGPPPAFDRITTVPESCAQQAETVVERARYETKRLLSRLEIIADALAGVPEPKAIVLVSGGTYSDGALREDLQSLAAVTERAHVSVSALFVEPDASAGGGSNTETRRLESQVGFGGLLDITALARGTAQRVIGTSMPALERLDRELSGVYLISFEREPADASGQRFNLDVRTRRGDVRLLTRRGLTPERTTRMLDAPATDLKGRVAGLLRSSAAVSQVPIDVDAFALPASAAGSEARIILSVEIGRDPSAVAALGFQLAEADGKVIGDGYDAPPAVQAIAPGRSGFVRTLSGASGRFIVRVATIDAQGQLGSVQHTFEVAPFARGPVRLSDLMLGVIDDGDFVPGTGAPSPQGTLAVRLVVRDSTGRFDGVRVKLVIARSADGQAVDTVELPLRETPDSVRRFADASIRATQYPQGEYIVSAIVTAQGAEVGRSQRAFIR